MHTHEQTNKSFIECYDNFFRTRTNFDSIRLYIHIHTPHPQKLAVRKGPTMGVSFVANNPSKGVPFLPTA